VIGDFRGPDDNGLYQCSVRLTAPDYDEESFIAAQYIRTIGKSSVSRQSKGVVDGFNNWTLPGDIIKPT